MRFLLGWLLISTLLFCDGFDDEFNDEFTQQQNDTFKSYNLFMTGINDTIYTNLLTPIAKGYKSIIHEEIRIGLSNAFSNIQYPVSFINNILQLKIENSWIETQRFLLNTTLGFIGFKDIAKSSFDLDAKKEDFGQTLGYYGFNNTPHIVLPLLGPSNLRDILGMGGDYFANPLSYIEHRGNLLANDTESTYTKAYNTLNEYSFTYIQYEKIKKDSINLYLLLKNAYEQKRDKEIKE